jgi:carboxyl-terminal processing protease
MGIYKRFAFVAIALLWSAILFGAGWMAHSVTTLLAAPPAPQPVFSENPILDEVWNHVREAFVGQVPSDTVRNYGAVRGALSTLDDRWSVFIEPQPRSIERDHLRGQFGGIGVSIEINKDGRIVLTPQPDSPAEAAGLKAGDILYAIDGEKLPDNPDFNAIAPRVRGDAGSVVRISVLRDGKVLDFDVKRVVIQIPSVEWRVITSSAPATPSVGYIAIHQFTERTGDEVKRAINELRRAGSQAYLIDLRDNGGGLLSAAVSVASHFLDGGVVLIEHKRDQPDITFPATQKGSAGAYKEPLTILINGNTASAAEIVAGAIQDRGRGKLIGDKSFGKGSVQSIYDLSDGSSVHVTSAKWLTPNKRTIDGEGLTPDIAVARADGEAGQNKDSQLERAVRELRTAFEMAAH